MVEGTAKANVMVLGTLGIGKSTVMNRLAGASEDVF